MVIIPFELLRYLPFLLCAYIRDITTIIITTTTTTKITAITARPAPKPVQHNMIS